ncbi:hydantoinase B/oxoprolinase family protein [Microbacterium sp. cf332]|uniref:hydantoinase B/oxoprolinase family protein n=1 Tax=Microbacterium sp. cf332 TaxID=1761804 RepID=UPI00088ED292|nr:hydantoinase B/oxoprolinase family protein [Microbacterium sp. cf332]SDQ94673.1 N-methylhydantoinase B [Microbacterium sp. cf332]
MTVLTDPVETVDTALDPISFSVIDAGLRAAVAEMKAVVLRTAYSNLWREAGDLSCALLDADGDIVAQGVGDIPIHLGSMPMTMRGVLDRIDAADLRPGDVVLQNDPYRGNNHMPDFFMAKPVFAGEQLIAFTAVRGHYVDIGGAAPGSYFTLATDIFGEGLRMPPVKIYREGRINQDVIDIITANVRNPDERLGDMRSQYAGCVTAERRLADFCERYGADVVVHAMRQMLDVSEQRARAAFSAIPDGRYEFEDYCDGDSFDPSPIAIHAAVEVRGDEVTIDFTGSSRQSRGGMNSPHGVTVSAAYFALKALSEPHTASNSGSYRPVRIIAPLGTIVNPHAPAPVVAGNHETSARIADVVLGALAQAVPDLVPAAGTGSATVLIVAREDVPDDAIMYEVHGAGQGGSVGNDGSHARRTSIGNTGNTPSELLEAAHPVRVLSYALTPDGGGAGRTRGGSGITRVLEFTERSTVTIVADRDRSRPYGLRGGRPGALARFELVLPDGEVRTLSSKTPPTRVPAGARLTFTCAGGGGYGDPAERGLAEIQDDLDDGYLSPEAARRDYGVTVEPAPGRPDGAWIVSR